MVHIFIMQAETGSEMLLNNAEIYGQYFAQALMNDNVNVSHEINESKSIVRNNIGNFATDTLIAYSTMLFITVIQAQFVEPSNVEAILFPNNIDLEQQTMFGKAQSILPQQFLIERGAMS